MRLIFALLREMSTQMGGRLLWTEGRLQSDISDVHIFEAFYSFRGEKQSTGPGLQVQLPHPGKRAIFFCLTLTEDVRLHDRRLKWRRCQWTGRGILGALEVRECQVEMGLRATCPSPSGSPLSLTAELKKRAAVRMSRGWGCTVWLNAK